MKGKIEPVRTGRWYSKDAEETARFVVGMDWSPSGLPLIRYRKRHPNGNGGHCLVETTSPVREWQSFVKWGAKLQDPTWEPTWAAEIPHGPSVK